MQTPTLPFPPTAIGGLGGSGTRVFAATLQHAGFHIGSQLNAPLDNLWFTVLFKRRSWTCSQPDPADIAVSVDLFRRAMTTGLQDQLSPAEQALLTRLRDDLVPHGSWRPGAQAVHAASLIASGPAPGRPDQPWGWKEPNTHIFLPHLDRHIPELHYIHVIRDGLDMAFSDNTWQMRHWGHLYGLPRDDETPPPLRQLRYWTAANRVAMDYGAHRMPGRFLAVQYEELCARPQHHWGRIRRFLGLPDSGDLPADLIRPTTIGRSRDHDLSFFPEADLEAALALQSEVETMGQLG